MLYNFDFLFILFCSGYFIYKRVFQLQINSPLEKCSLFFITPPRPFSNCQPPPCLDSMVQLVHEQLQQ